MAITDYIDFVNNYLTKNGMIGNAANINKAPDQLKLEVDELNAEKVSWEEFNKLNLGRADKWLAMQDIAKMIYNAQGDLEKLQYINAVDVNYEIFTYTNGDLSGIAHYVDSVLKGNTVLNYLNGDLSSVIFTGV